MFKKTIKPLAKPTPKKPIKQRNNEYSVMFSRVEKHGTESINLSIKAEICRKAKLCNHDKVDVLVDQGAKKIRIERCNEGITLCKPSESSLRTTYAIQAGRLTTKLARVIIDKVKTGTGFIEFEMPDDIHVKRKPKVKK
jgi:hypothetical protein